MKRTTIISMALVILLAVAGVFAYRALSRHKQEKDLAAAQQKSTLAAYENYIRQWDSSLPSGHPP
jgi:predicted negative regulator of RcsB-dependent stress response